MTVENISLTVGDFDESVKEALVAAAAYLKKRDLSRAEIQERLVRRGFGPEIVESCLTFLVSKRLIREELVVEKALNMARGSKAKGDSLIAEKLVARGLPLELIQSKLAESDNGTEAERAMELLKAKFPRGGSVSKLGRFLWSRGFAEETIDSVLATYAAPNERLEEELEEV